MEGPLKSRRQIGWEPPGPTEVGGPSGIRPTSLLRQTPPGYHSRLKSVVHGVASGRQEPTEVGGPREFA